MSGIRGLTVVVGAWYARTHAICAARNMRHLVETVVVTDAATAPLLADVPGQRVHVTDAFTRADANGAVPLFNKGLAAFMARWPAERRALLPMEVLHLGPIDTHWYGSDEAGKALMAALVNAHHWHRSALIGRPEAAARAASLPGRLVVPGYEPSTFRLPFERP
jgi:hypothetical protein